VKKSYFGEMLGIHGGAELVPHRPTASLWKAARLERLAAGPPPVQLPASPRAITTGKEPAREAAAAPPQPRPRTDADTALPARVIPTKAAHVPAHSEMAPTPVPAELTLPIPTHPSDLRADEDAVPRVLPTKAGHVPAPAEIMPAPIPVELKQPVSVRTPPDPPARRNHEQTSDTHPRAEKSATPVSRKAPSEWHVRLPASHSGQRPLKGTAAPDAPLPPSAPLTHAETPPELTPNFPAPKIRSTLVASNSAPHIISESQARPQPPEPNAIHVGRIEVQVVSPLPARSSIPQRPGRLAHGYGLCFDAW
jgi:hypothetical protein